MASDALNTANEVHAIGRAARQVFIDRDELIDAIECCLLAGEHLIVLGPPGTGKSACIRFFAGAAGLRFYRKLLNPDTTREDVVGPIDPMALKRGIWDRKWAGLATCDVAFLDEVGKASSQVINMLLDAMEERKVTSGDVDRDIPLHLVMSASNETIDESPAVWDRFTVRLIVRRIQEAGAFATLIEKAWQALKPPSIPVDGDALREARVECVRMASEAYRNDSVMRTLMKMWQEVGSHVSENVSDRRWLRVLVVAAAKALLAGRTTIEPRDLSVAKWVLWSDIDDVVPVASFVREVLDEEQKQLSMAVALVDEIEVLSVPWMVNGESPMSSGNLQNAAMAVFRAEQLLQTAKANANGGTDGWSDVVIRLEKIRAAASETSL